MPQKIAYIDGQNIYRSIKASGYTIDRKAFFYFLQKRYKVNQVKLFLGYIPKRKRFYKMLKVYGYTLIFKNTSSANNIIKGNVDTALVLEAVRDYYLGKIGIGYLITNDGDFDVLVSFLGENGKLGKLLCRDINKTSILLKRSTPRNKIHDLTTVSTHICKKIPT